MAVDTVKNLFAVAELRKRILFTLGLLVVYRIGGHITIPGVNIAALAVLADQARNSGSMFGTFVQVFRLRPTSAMFAACANILFAMLVGRS